ncbi:MAG: PBP1A family penicillin-binding protein [Xenococcaceae cyanobacterium MO_188.B29]|nr:PBP1A family penicillin-binding protein [Xenococcaceae cyanobacterium MO_188.B29]
MNPTPNSQSELPDNSQPQSTPLSLPSNRFLRKTTLAKRPTFLWLTMGMVMGISGGVIAFSWLWQKLEASIPANIEDVETYARPETLTIKANDGSILKQIGPIAHEEIKLDEVPAILPSAFVASEDRRFWQHKGIDFQGIARATIANLRAGGVVEGGSTITQQVARVVFLNHEQSIERKLKEMKIATVIERNFDKEQILENYLNIVYLGSGSYGVADAAWVYFGKSPQELNLSEAATLAGIVPAPSTYSPLNNKELAIKRRNLVLQRMAKDGLISQAEANAAIASPLITNPHRPKRLVRKASYFTNYVEKELPKYISEEQLKAGGVVVETTLNYQWQKAAEEAINYSLDKYSKGQKFQQAALVALDPKTGEIKAMVGGRDFGANQYNRVTQAQRQPGSTFKTFVYATAIAAGFSPYKTYFDAEYFVDGYQPTNYKDRYRYSNVSLYSGLKSSINIVALRTLLDVGWKPTIEIAQKMGIKSELQPTYSLALGAWEVNLLELTNAYATLANQGTYHPGYGITRVLDRQGKVIYESNFKAQKALDADTAAIMTWMLQGVVNSGTAIPAQIGRPAAGKTGTSDESRDLWYIGYIPQVAAGVWLGNDDNTPTEGTSGFAAELWRKFMLPVVKDLPVENFPPRPSLTNREAFITAEAVKPKRSYYLKRTPARPVYRTTRSRRTYSTSPKTSTTSSSAPKSPPKPAKPIPATTPFPVPVSKPAITKPIKQLPPNNSPQEPERDWVRERLGR